MTGFVLSDEFLTRCARSSGQPTAVTPLRSVSLCARIAARRKEKVTKEKARPTSGARCARLPSLHPCSRGTLRRAIPGPSQLSRQPCRSTPFTGIPLGLLRGPKPWPNWFRSSVSCALAQPRGPDETRATAGAPAACGLRYQRLRSRPTQRPAGKPCRGAGPADSGKAPARPAAAADQPWAVRAEPRPRAALAAAKPAPAGLPHR
jgi:hypothetical protein